MKLLLLSLFAGALQIIYICFYPNPKIVKRETHPIMGTLYTRSYRNLIPWHCMFIFSLLIDLYVFYGMYHEFQIERQKAKVERLKLEEYRRQTREIETLTKDIQQQLKDIEEARKILESYQNSTTTDTHSGESSQPH